MNEKTDVHIFVWPAIQCARRFFFFFFFFFFIHTSRKRNKINSHFLNGPGFVLKFFTMSVFAKHMMG